MKILLVVTKGDLGGAQKRIIDLAEQYREAGHEVVVASGPGEYLPAELKKQDIEYVRFEHLSRDNPLKIIRYILELWRFLRTRSFDIVHLNSSSALAGALSARFTSPKPKVVFTFRGLSVLAPGYRVTQLKKDFYRHSYQAFLKFVDVGVFQCEANREVAHEAEIKAGREEIIMDGINGERIDFLPREGARKELTRMVGQDLRGKRLVGSIGRLSYQKHYAFLVRQLRKLQKYREDVVAIIIGDGPERKHLEDCIERLNMTESVFLVGKKERAARLIRGFDVFTLVSRYEGLSMTLTEAMHAGVPLLVSDVGCAREVVGDKRMVFAPGDAIGFVSNLLRLLELKSEDREAMSEAVRERGRRLTLERSARQYLELYKSISKGS